MKTTDDIKFPTIEEIKTKNKNIEYIRKNISWVIMPVSTDQGIKLQAIFYYKFKEHDVTAFGLSPNLDGFIDDRMIEDKIWQIISEVLPANAYTTLIERELQEAKR